MRNYIQPGAVLAFIAPVGGVVGGNAYLFDGATLAVATDDADAGDTFQGQIEGVFELPKTSAQAWATGDLLYWDTVNFRADTSNAVGPLVGCAGAAAANPSSTGAVRLHT